MTAFEDEMSSLLELVETEAIGLLSKSIKKYKKV